MTDDALAPAPMVDIAFALSGSVLPREYRRLLADALRQVLPWLADEPVAGPHPLKTDDGDRPQALLARRSRLLIRVPRHRIDEALALQGRVIAVGPQTLTIGDGQVRELLPWGTLYSSFVATTAPDEPGFLQGIDGELGQLGIRCRVICGRAQRAEAGQVRGFSLMLDGLAQEAALRVQSQGLGPLRGLGFGVFVPHKSAAAVGAPP